MTNEVEKQWTRPAWLRIAEPLVWPKSDIKDLPPANLMQVRGWYTTIRVIDPVAADTGEG